jgi:hypothetical protein
MRFGRESRERMAWLVEFLKAWYSSREMLDETERLAARFAELVKAGDKALAVETLDYRQLLADAMDDRFKGSATDRLVNDCLDAGEMDRLRVMVGGKALMQLCSTTLERLVKSGLITAQQSEAEDGRRRHSMGPVWEDVDPERLEALLRADVLFNMCRYHEAISVLTQHADQSAWKRHTQGLLARSSRNDWRF